jgi:uncharacterized cupin superfamily protein
MAETTPLITNSASAPVETMTEGAWGGDWKVLTAGMRERGGSLGVVQMLLEPGHTTCPFHWHAREDEVFIVQSGRGVLRYGDHLRQIGPGDCISCPAGTQIAHQICNPFDETLVYLAIGPRDPHEVCGYPDSGKLLVRAAGVIGVLEKTHYMAGEPEQPRIFELWDQREG